MKISINGISIMMTTNGETQEYFARNKPTYTNFNVFSGETQNSGTDIAVE